MAEGPKYQITFQFKNVQILRDRSLGMGSFGAVYKAKCDDLICAAKIIHPTLFDPNPSHRVAPQKEHRLPIRRFEQECEFMSAIKHPNIVQYLGMFRDTNTYLPVLLMELMDNSLTHFLESSIEQIPYHVQVNICHDITLALSFLHSNNIIHRDLSSNNVLLRGNILAKVTDFGMARLDDINPRATHFTNTTNPGTDVYMPPEAVQDRPVYTEKIDCFSFGVITVQILTQQFPKPGDRLERIEINHPGLPTGLVTLVEVSEINRRQNHISQIPPNHSLQPIALDCLKDKDSERPSAHQLCERVAALKGTSTYIENARTRDGIIQSPGIEENEHTILSTKEENQQLRQQLQQERDQANRQLEERERQLGQVNQQLRQLQQENDQISRENARQIEEKEAQLGRVNKQLEASEELVAMFERRISELEQQLNQNKQQNPETGSSEQEPTSLKLRWRAGKRAPCGLNGYCDAVVDGNKVYAWHAITVKIYTYDVISDRWSKLPDCVPSGGSIAIINGWLTTIGGYSHGYTNELLSLTGEGNSRKWTEKFPPMPTKRGDTNALCIETALIVSGGRGEDGVLSKVEVMNTENHQWSTAVDLPEPKYWTSTTVYEGQIYMLGGWIRDNNTTKSAYTCSVSDMLQSCVSSSMLAKSNKTSIWRQIPDLPVSNSICVSFKSRLLAVGGWMDQGKATTAVYMYNSTASSWEIISYLAVARYHCFTAVLPNNQLIVMGGGTGVICTDSVEFASVDN